MSNSDGNGAPFMKTEGVYETHRLGYNSNSRSRGYRGKTSRGRYREVVNLTTW